MIWMLDTLQSQAKPSRPQDKNWTAWAQLSAVRAYRVQPSVPLWASTTFASLHGPMSLLLKAQAGSGCLVQSTLPWPIHKSILEWNQIPANIADWFSFIFLAQLATAEGVCVCVHPCTLREELVDLA